MSQLPSNFKQIVLSKLLGRTVASSLHIHHDRNNLQVKSQSAYRTSETALLRTLNELFTTVDRRNNALSVLSDLSAGFGITETNAHALLLQRLRDATGPDKTAHS